MSERKVIITADSITADKFVKSTCNCKVCSEKCKIEKEWDEFIPKNNLQKRMKDIVSRIEDTTENKTDNKK